MEALICSAHIAAWFGDGLRRKGKRDEPIAWSTAFGWTLGGLAGERGEITSELEDVEDHVSINLLTSSTDSELRESIDRLFYNDFPWIRDEDKKDLLREARYALEQLRETTIWDVDAGKYKAGLPYKMGREKTAKILNSVDTATLGKTLVILSDSHITPSRYFFIVNLTLFKTETKKIVLKIVRITIYQSFRHNQKRKTTLERSDKPPLRP